MKLERERCKRQDPVPRQDHVRASTLEESGGEWATAHTAGLGCGPRLSTHPGCLALPGGTQDPVKGIAKESRGAEDGQGSFKSYDGRKMGWGGIFQNRKHCT